MDLPRRASLARSRRRGLAALAVVTAATLVAAVLATPAASAPGSVRAPGPVGEIRGAEAPTAVPGTFVVVLKDSAVGGPAGTRQAAVSTLAADVTSRFGVQPDRVWGDALNGFSVRTSEAVARRIAAHPAVAYVEADQTVQLATTQLNAPWNLDRLDATAGLDVTYSYQSQGSGIPVYVIDSGIHISHQEFGGQAYYGYDAIDGTLPAEDCSGHGTHVAANIGGTTYGVAKNVALVAVKVVGDCTGIPSTLAMVINGINWVAADHQPWDPPAVANIALLTGVSSAVNTAVANLVVDGVTVTVAAGNSNANACNFPPASVPTALTVGATQSNDARASFSNFGTCLDLFAPGVNIVSAVHLSNTATTPLSGTSQASAHVAGMAARVLSNNPTWTPAQVAGYLTSVANPAVINPGTGSPNRLLYMSPLL
ncbi:serine protease [Micromonospora echinospora]|uniref:Peptidase inhibitor I9 n=1 Tax=Micromonospora echinospora TaxID=1877 RepID=A0A1C4VH46_MICEC|nr:S8 family peptidase [Micromonospora echinospora]OZV74972.1 serine protease [Micromonospora echinospora]SCE83324.1 Peptidase inhibitor I9 [Micromonospora echinospora]